MNANDILVLPLNMNNLEKHQDALNKVLAHFGKLDVLINNAARYQNTLFEECTLEMERSLFETNVFGVINLTRIAVKHWLSTKTKGHLVVTSSISGFSGSPASSAYAATKHALHGFYDSIRVEYAHRGIDVSLICPGPVETELLTKSLMPDGMSPPEDPKFRFKIMKAERCAFLYSVAIANRVNLAWIVPQPYLTMAILAQYMPFFSRWVIKFLVSEEKVREVANGNYS